MTAPVLLRALVCVDLGSSLRAMVLKAPEMGNSHTRPLDNRDTLYVFYLRKDDVPREMGNW